MAQIKQLAATALLALVSLGVGVLIVEASLRVLSSTVTGIRDDVVLVADESIGFKRAPDQNTRLDSSCFSVPVSINSSGFRDTEWTDDQPIVILGDSYTEALQVGDAQNFPALVEQLTGVSVANLGRSSFGTVGELATFKAYGKALKPKVVVLMFYADNDINDNNCAISRGPNGTVTKPCGEVRDNTVSYPQNYYSTSGSHALRSFVREHCKFCVLVKEFMERSEVDRPETISRERIAQFLPRGSAGERIEESWQITQAALADLQAEVHSVGAELIVVTVPSVLEYAYDPTASLKERFGGAGVPTDLVVGEPTRRLSELAATLEIPFVPLQGEFIKYRDTHELREPLFSYRCDGHWNPLGHAVAAGSIVQLLATQSDSFASMITSDAIVQAQKLLETSPLDFFGESSLEAIYHGGVYISE